MAARKRISQVALTTTGIDNSSTMSNYCPHTSGSSKENAWFEYLIVNILSRSGGKFKLPLSVSGGDYLMVDKGLVTSITITLS